jgi:hypothetical protein
MLFHAKFSLWMIWRSKNWKIVVEKELQAYWRIVDHVKDPMLGVDIDVVVVEQLEIATLHDDGYFDS